MLWAARHSACHTVSKLPWNVLSGSTDDQTPPLRFGDDGLSTGQADSEE